MKTSPEINEISKALFAVQTNIRAVGKNATNPFHKNKYADLGAHLEVVMPELQSNGILIIQSPCHNGLTTRFVHVDSSQFIEDTMIIDGLTNDPQKHGSAVTYMRRYMMGAMLGLVAEDDDGNQGRQNPQQQNRNNNQQQQQQQNQNVNVQALNQQIEALVQTVGVSDNDGNNWSNWQSFTVAKKQNLLTYLKKLKGGNQ